MAETMAPEQIWSHLDNIFHMSPAALYADEEMERLHTECVRRVEGMARSDKRVTLSRYVRDSMLSEQAIAEGRGWEDVLAFLDWVECGME